MITYHHVDLREQEPPPPSYDGGVSFLDPPHPPVELESIAIPHDDDIAIDLDSLLEVDASHFEKCVIPSTSGIAVDDDCADVMDFRSLLSNPVDIDTHMIPMSVHWSGPKLDRRVHKMEEESLMMFQCDKSGIVVFATDSFLGEFYFLKSTFVGYHFADILLSGLLAEGHRHKYLKNFLSLDNISMARKCAHLSSGSITRTPVKICNGHGEMVSVFISTLFLGTDSSPMWECHITPERSSPFHSSLALCAIPPAFCNFGKREPRAISHAEPIVGVIKVGLSSSISFLAECGSTSYYSFQREIFRIVKEVESDMIPYCVVHEALGDSFLILLGMTWWFRCTVVDIHSFSIALGCLLSSKLSAVCSSYDFPVRVFPRVGVSVGTVKPCVIGKQFRVFGRSLNLATLLESVCPCGMVCTTSTSKSIPMSRVDASFDVEGIGNLTTNIVLVEEVVPMMMSVLSESALGPKESYGSI